MSTLDAEKYKAFFEGMNGAVDVAPPPDVDGVLEEFVPPPELALAVPPLDGSADTESPVETSLPVEELFQVSLAAAEDLVALLDAALAAYLTPADYSVTLEERGVVVRLADHALFASGSAALDAAATDVLAVVAGVLADDVDNDIEIEGHTDDRPTVASSFPSNWELSSARASTVLRYLLQTSDLVPQRLAAVGRADTVPLASNETAAGRAENRRTEVVVLFPGLQSS